MVAFLSIVRVINARAEDLFPDRDRAAFVPNEGEQEIRRQPGVRSLSVPLPVCVCAPRIPLGQARTPRTHKRHWHFCSLRRGSCCLADKCHRLLTRGSCRIFWGIAASVAVTVPSGDQCGTA